MTPESQTYIILVVGIVTTYILVHTIRYFNDKD